MNNSEAFCCLRRLNLIYNMLNLPAETCCWLDCSLIPYFVFSYFFYHALLNCMIL
jgi:hypothetical protein